MQNIKNKTLPKVNVILIALIFFLIAFAYNLLRAFKSAMLISVPDADASIITFLKVWGVLPGIFLFTYLYTRLSRFLKKDQIFYTMIAIFTSFFILFATILHPYSSYFEWDSAENFLKQIVPQNLKGVILMIKYWHLSSFYIFSELWGTVIMSILFWGYVNEVTNVKNAKKSYAMFALSANVAAISAGLIGTVIANQQMPLLEEISKDNRWRAIGIAVTATLFLCSFLILSLFTILNTRIKKENSQQEKEKEQQVFRKLKKFSIKESLYIVRKSKHLCHLAIIVISYNLIFNLSDLIWTDQVMKWVNYNPVAMSSFISKVTIIKGCIATLITFLFTEKILSKFGWTVGALLTPTIIIITSVLFLPLVILDQSPLLSSIESYIPISIITLAVYSGTFQNCMTRASKYTFFDATKEMAYIPLDPSLQRKGKASIDGIGSRIGKSGGSLLLQSLLYFFSTISATVPCISVLILIVSLLWVRSTKILGNIMKNFEAKT